MKNQHTIQIVFFAILLLAGTENLWAQKDTTRMRQEVEVTKAYQPTVPDAVKINDIPKIKNEQTEAPTFDYSIYSKPIFSTFDLTPVAAAKMVGEPHPEMEMGLLKLGLGNYLTPYGELFFNARPGKKSNFGMHFRHLSSRGNVDLLNDDLVKAPQSENSAEIFGKHFFRKSTLSGSLSFDRKAFTYYGYTGDLLTHDEKEQLIPYFADKQYFSKGEGNVRLKSETLAKYDFNYDFGVGYHYLISKTGQTEKQTNFSGLVSKKFDSALGLLDVSVVHYQVDSIWNNTTYSYGQDRQFILEANPSFKWSTKTASIQLGLNTALELKKDDDGKFLIWPKVKAEWSPVERVLTLFVGIDGHLQHNTYSSVAEENPYIDPYHDVLNTNFKHVFSGGFKGKLSPKTNYVTQASYSVVEDQHFYITESRNLYDLTSSSRRLNNTFSWIYDDVNILRLSGEVLHTVSDDFSFQILGNYYSYDLKSLPQAWQMPNFDLTLSATYKPTEQLKFTTDIFVIGKRTALLSDIDFTKLISSLGSDAFTDKEICMDPIIDLNAGVEYRFSDKLNFFVKLNNFGFQRYEQWLGYTNKSFNWMAGISYSF